MTPHLALRKGVRAVALAVFFALAFGFAGVIAGFVIGMAISAYYEQVLHIGNPQGPLLMLLTGPLGAVGGIVYGLWKGIRMRDPNPAFDGRAK
jgi:hypothetical protein